MAGVLARLSRCVLTRRTTLPSRWPTIRGITETTYSMLTSMAGALVLCGMHGACLRPLATLLGRRPLVAGGPSHSGRICSSLTQPGKGKEAAEACSQDGRACVHWLSVGHIFLGVRRRLCWRRSLLRLALRRRGRRALRGLAGLLARAGRGSSPGPSAEESKAVSVIRRVCQHLHCSRAPRGSTGATTVLCAGGVHHHGSGAFLERRAFPERGRSLQPACSLTGLAASSERLRAP